MNGTTEIRRVTVSVTALDPLSEEKLEGLRKILLAGEIAFERVSEEYRYLFLDAKRNYARIEEILDRLIEETVIFSSEIDDEERIESL